MGTDKLHWIRVIRAIRGQIALERVLKIRNGNFNDIVQVKPYL